MKPVKACLRVKTFGNPLSRATIFTAKLVCIEVNLYKLFKTTIG